MSFSQTITEFLVANRILLSFVCLIGTLVVFALLEDRRPRKTQSGQKLRQRWPANFGLLVLDQINITWLTAFATVVVAWWLDGKQIGLMQNMEINFWVAVLLTMLTFEFFSYVFHRLLHAVPMLWRIHAVHHCDTEIDFTTTFRAHPIELLFLAPISIPLVLLMGFPLAAVVVYQLIRTLVLIFAHSNIQLPEKVDTYLRLFITTPDYHRLHHSSDKQYTDSNFSPILPLYDYLFGTATKIPYAHLPNMDLGLEYLRSSKQTGFINLLLLPFTWRKQTPELKGQTALQET